MPEVGLAFVGAKAWQAGAEQRPAGLDAFNREANAGDFVDVEMVSDDHIPGVERGDQHLLDVGEKAGTIDRAIEDAWDGEAGDTERGEERTRLPPATRGVVMDAGAAACQSRRARCQAGRVRTGAPFLLTVTPSACTARQIVGRLAAVASASFSSTSVRSGCSAISAAKVCRCGSSIGRRP